MENVAPFKPTWNITFRDDNAFVNETGTYGAYTCYMDQVNGIMHSGAYQDGSAYGYDVINRRSLGKTDSKNAYAMSGDNKGNLISDVGVEIKSATYEKKADRYWFTDGSILYNAAPDCVVNKTRNCQTAPGTVSTTIPGFTIQAISGLPEGIIALSYGGDAYYVKYDGKDFHTTRLLMKEGGGTSSGTTGLYMYTDFTGNALYSGGNDLTFDFTETPGYDSAREAQGLYFIWKSDEGLEKWSNLVLKVRCFTEADLDPSFVEVETVKKQSEVTVIDNAQCQGNVTKAEIQIESLNGSDNITKVTNLQLYLNQKK
jgi:hypothetical protein